MKPSIDIARETWINMRREQKGPPDPLDIVGAYATAIDAARAEAIEEAAKWHDERAKRFFAQGTLRAGDIARSHQHSAAAIRALAQTREPARGKKG